MMNNTRALPRDKYFAAVERDELATTLMAKAEKFRERLDREGRIDVWRRSERTYYGHDGDGGLKNSVAVTFDGDEGENVVARVNHYRSIIQAIIAMVTAQRPAWKARAINTDVESLSQTSVAEGVVDWVYRSKGIEDMRVEQVERAVVSAEGYLHLRWDVYAGRKIDEQQRPVYDEGGSPVMDEQQVPEPAAAGDMNAPMPPSGMQQEPPRMVTQQVPRTEPYPVREGDIAPAVLGPLEVVRDLDARELKWAMAPHRENVWDLVARFPQMRAHLLALRGQEQWPRGVWGDGTWETPDDDDDSICVWCFYHPPSDALPKGRYAVFAGEVVLADEEWRFGDEIPIYGLLPMREMGTGSGHSPIWDLLCLQSLYDTAFTSLANATEGMGEGNVLAPKGSDIDTTMLARGRQLIEYDVVEGAPDGGRPSALTGLFDVSADAYKLEEILKRTMETLSGINSVTRGDPDSNLKSGAALALVQSMTTHFNSALQGAVVRNDERVGTGVLKLYQRFSPVPRLAEITGKQNATELKEFTSENLRSIQRVTVEVGNPAMRGAGAVELALEFLKAGVITTTSEFAELVESGRIEPLFEDVRDEMRLIRGENELLAAGQPVKVSATDIDQNHIKRHARVLDDPGVRSNDAVVNAVVQHIMEHQQALGTKAIELMWAIGQEIPPWRMPGQGAPPEGPPGAEPPPPDGPRGGGDSKPMPVERAQPMGAPSSPDMPLMPMNPSTGERAPAGPPQ